MSELDTRLIEAALTRRSVQGGHHSPAADRLVRGVFARSVKPMAAATMAAAGCARPIRGTSKPAMAQVRRYPWGLLYQTIGAIEDSFDIEGMSERAREHAQVSQRVQAGR